MSNKLLRFSMLLILMSVGTGAFAQAATGASGSNILLYTLGGTAVLLFFYMLINVADNLVGIEAKQRGLDVDKHGLSILPSTNFLFGGKKTVEGLDGPLTVLKKGYDINLEGKAAGQVTAAQGVTRYAVQPPNFRGLSPIPKMVVQEGDTVKAGDALFFDKMMPEVHFVAPVSGEVIAINRGAKRAITEVVILADKEQQYRSYNLPDLAAASVDELRAFLMESGAWSLLRQRPYNITPRPGDTPRDIFISTFDTAPLAPDNNLVVQGQEAAFQKGIDVLARLTEGSVYLGLDGRGGAVAAAFSNAANCKKHYFKGKHPAGNVGVHIHHTAPVGGDDKVWTLGVQEVISLGKLFMNGQFDASRVIAVAGAELETPKYVRTYTGANVGELVQGNLTSDNVRLVSGDALSGQAKTAEGFMDWYDDQLSVIAEGNDYELFGWLIPSSLRPSISNTFPNFLFPDATFRANTNTHGEKRAFVVTNDYEQVLPMDIIPQQLMKAITYNDIERMEGLGIKELVEEDIALCEFVCVSKQPLQQILREGLESVREQG